MLMGKREGRRPGIIWSSLDNNILSDFHGTQHEAMDWIHLHCLDHLKHGLQGGNIQLRKFVRISEITNSHLPIPRRNGGFLLIYEITCRREMHRFTVILKSLFRVLQRSNTESSYPEDFTCKQCTDNFLSLERF